MDNCCHGDCKRGDECPHFKPGTPADRRLGFILVAVVCLVFWAAFFAKLVWARS